MFGKYHIQAVFKPKTIAKSDAVQEKIHDRIRSAFLFNNLDNKDFKVVIDAMDQMHASKGTKIIEEGASGDVLYIVESGELSCHKIINGENTFLKTYKAGDVFGELALLYGAPRAATIIAESDVECWVLDRLTFNHIVKDAAQKKRQRYEDFLKTVPILENIDHYERSKMADAIKEVNFRAHENIICQGDLGESFFILVEGECIATLKENPDNAVMAYKPGDYFGELALLRNEPRNANVIATTDCKLISLERNSFTRLIGPLSKIL